DGHAVARLAREMKTQLGERQPGDLRGEDDVRHGDPMGGEETAHLVERRLDDVEVEARHRNGEPEPLLDDDVERIPAVPGEQRHEETPAQRRERGGLQGTPEGNLPYEQRVLSTEA